MSNDNDNDYELRASWHEFDVPDSEAAALMFENSRVRASMAAQASIDRATGILMAAHRTDDNETIERLLRRVAATSRLRLGDLAQAVVEVACGTPHPSHPRAAQVVTSQLLRPAVDEADRSGQTPLGEGPIDLRGAAAGSAREGG